MGEKSTDIPLPKAWPEHARSAIVHVIAMARTAIVYARGKAAKMPVPGASLRAKLDNARAQIALLREELRIKKSAVAGELAVRATGSTTAREVGPCRRARGATPRRGRTPSCRRAPGCGLKSNRTAAGKGFSMGARNRFLLYPA